MDESLRFVEGQFSQAEWTDIVSGFEDLSLMQTWEYGAAFSTDERWHIVRGVFERAGERVGALQAVTRRAPVLAGGLVWINRGPLWRRSGGTDPRIVGDMLRALRRHWVEDRAMYIRIAPAAGANELDPASVESAGYCIAPDGNGWVSARLDLSLSLDALRAGLDKTWRNSLANAERRGLEVLPDSAESFDLVLSIYTKQHEAHPYQTTVTPEFLRRLQSRLPSGRKLLALSARDRGQSLGGVLIALYGSTGEYLVGAIEDAGRAVNVGQLLVWEAVSRLKALGCRCLDLGGMDPRYTSEGVMRFKSGLNGQPYTYVGEFEASNRSWTNRAVRWRVSRARKGIA